jgi:hypothetical protein
MAKIASSAKIRRRLHALSVAFGLLALLTVIMFTRQSVGM